VRNVSDLITPERLMASAHLTFSSDSYFAVEMKIFTALGFRFKYTTPFDYIDTFMALFPFFPKMRDAFPLFLEFALIHPNACQFTAEEVFFGAVMAILEIKHIHLNEFLAKIMRGLTDSWSNANHVKSQIIEGIS
jgi:hypothetical protein